MADTTRGVLRAVQSILKADAGITALVNQRIYGATPIGPTYPFILINCSDSQPFGAQDFSGMSHTLRVQAFERENKPAMVLTLRELIFAAIDRKEASFAQAGQPVVMAEFAMADAFAEDDGRTYQSVIEFTITAS